MVSDDHRIRDDIPSPAGGYTSVREAISRALHPPTTTTPSSATAVGVDALQDPLTLAETDADWAGEQT